MCSITFLKTVFFFVLNLKNWRKTSGNLYDVSLDITDVLILYFEYGDISKPVVPGDFSAVLLTL